MTTIIKMYQPELFEAIQTALKKSHELGQTDSTAIVTHYLAYISKLREFDGEIDAALSDADSILSQENRVIINAMIMAYNRSVSFSYQQPKKYQVRLPGLFAQVLIKTATGVKLESIATIRDKDTQATTLEFTLDEIPREYLSFATESTSSPMTKSCQFN